MRERKKRFTPKAGNIRDSDPNRTQPIPSGSTGNIINSGIITHPPFSSDLQSCQGHHVYNLLQRRFDTYRYSSCSISTILRTHTDHEKSRQDLQYPARPMADMGTSLNSPRPVMCHNDIISHFPGREASVPLKITSSPVENVCAWQPRWPEMPSKQVIISHYFRSNIIYTLNMTPLSIPLPTGRSLREHKIRNWRLRKHITTLRIKITMQLEYGQGKRPLDLVLSHSECSFNFMNTDTISVKIDQDSNFIKDSLVFTLSTLMYIREYKYQTDYNGFNSSLVVINLFAPLTALQTTLSDSYRETRTHNSFPPFVTRRIGFFTWSQQMPDICKTV